MEILQRNSTPIRMRNYGRIIEQMIAVAAEEKDKPTQEQMLLYIARCMRQKNQVWNKDQEAGLQRIKDDIYTLSDGQLNCDFPAFEQEQQHMQKNNQLNFQGSKKKKKA
ncbi:MAG: DUF4290 domain-containing protein [Paludibacteraceae bacterium]|nr:DUF4290 domain-containing protein [Paludibacteraceae bacterium]